MPLPLASRLQTSVLSELPIRNALNAIVGEAAKRAVHIVALHRRPIEQTEVAAVPHVAERRAAAIAAIADRQLSVQRSVPRIVDITRGRLLIAARRVKISCVTTDGRRAKANGAAAALCAKQAADLAVVRRAIRLPRALDERLLPARIGQLVGDHVDHAPNRIRAVQHTRRSANHFDPLREPRVN